MVELPDDVTELARALGDLETVAALLFLERTRARSVSIDEIHAQLRCRNVVAICERLARENLVELRLGTTLRYQYAPASPARDRAVARLSEAYDRERETIKEILSHPSVRGQ